MAAAEVVGASAIEAVVVLVTEVADAVGSAVTVGVVGLAVTAVSEDADEVVTVAGGEAAEVEEAHALALSLRSRGPRSLSTEHVAITIHAHMYCLHSTLPKMMTCHVFVDQVHVTHITRTVYTYA